MAPRIGTIVMPSASSAASNAGSALARAKWTKVTDPVERRAATAAATEARVAKAIDKRIDALIAIAPRWTDEQRTRIAVALQGGKR